MPFHVLSPHPTREKDKDSDEYITAEEESSSDIEHSDPQTNFLFSVQFKLLSVVLPLSEDSKGIHLSYRLTLEIIWN
jgi:hypothetical protein